MNIDVNQKVNKQAPYQTTSAELLVFVAEHCAPSRMLGAALRQLETGQLRHVGLQKFDAARDRDAFERFGIQGTPTVILTQGGKIVKRHKGMLTAADLRAWVEDQPKAATQNQHAI